MVKGREVMVIGRIRTHEWERDGEKIYRKEIIAESVELTGGRRDTSPDNEPEAAPASEQAQNRRGARRRGGRRGGRRPERGTAPPEPPDARVDDIDDLPI